MTAAVTDRPALWDRSCFRDEELDEAGIAFSGFANALQVWSVMQRRPTTVAEAAAVFNVLPSVVIESVDAHPWMDFAGDRDDPLAMTIEHEGE